MAVFSVLLSWLLVFDDLLHDHHPNLANKNHTPPGRVISAVSMEELFHMEILRVAKSQSDMNVSALGILEKALEYV